MITHRHIDMCVFDSDGKELEHANDSHRTGRDLMQAIRDAEEEKATHGRLILLVFLIACFIGGAIGLVVWAFDQAAAAAMGPL